MLSFGEDGSIHGEGCSGDEGGGDSEGGDGRDRQTCKVSVREWKCALPSSAEN